MQQQMKILAVDQNAESLKALKRTLNFPDMEIIHEVGFGPAALTWARSLQPDLVLVAAEEPLARPLSTIELLSQGSPSWTVVALAGQFERELFRKVVLAGARDVLPRSATADELHDALANARRVALAQRAPAAHDLSAPVGTVITVFGVKGGIGKTTIAVNLATSLALETSRSVALVDLDLPFGDIAVMLDLRPERDVLTALEEGVLDDTEQLQFQLTAGPAGVHVLPAPLVPDGKLSIEAAQAGRLITRLAALHDFVIVDTPPGVNEIVGAALDASALGLLVTTPEVPCLRRTQSCARLLQDWDYSPDKIKVVLNRATSKTGINDNEVEDLLGYSIAWRVMNDRAAMRLIALGQPVVTAQPKSALATGIRQIARQIGGLPFEQRGFDWRNWLPRQAVAAAQL